MLVVGGTHNFPELGVRALENEKREGSRSQSSWGVRLDWCEEGILVSSRDHSRMSQTEKSAESITHRGIDQRSEYIKANENQVSH